MRRGGREEKVGVKTLRRVLLCLQQLHMAAITELLLLLEVFDFEGAAEIFICRSSQVQRHTGK